MAITPLSTPPSRSDPANFAPRSDTFFSQLPTFAAEVTALQVDVNNKQVTASTAASTATAAAAAAAAAAGASIWVSGTNYAIGDCRFSPITYQSFRRKVAGAGTTDPSLDGANWVFVTHAGESFSGVTSTAVSATMTTAHIGQLYKITAAAKTITFPAIAASPAGSVLSISATFAAGVATLDGNGGELIANTFGVTSATFVLNAGESAQFVSNGVSWDSVGSHDGEAFSGVTSTAVSATMTTAHIGQLYKVTAAGQTITLPAIAASSAGSVLSITAAFAAGVTTLDGNGGELIANTFGVTAATFVLNAGEAVQLVSNGVSWDPIGYESIYGNGNLDFAAKSLNGGPLAGNRNRIINGNFAVNQRVVSGAVTLAAGAYGHDRWKAGAAGCTYTFATVGTTTTLTITAGSLVQVIEGSNVEQAAYTMSWTGTAQGRILAGAYAASPVALAATAGSNLSVEFGTGTLTKVQVEPGSIWTLFEQRPVGLELSLCQRYYCHSFPVGIAPSLAADAGTLLGTAARACGCDSLENNGKFTVQLPVEMRAAPTITLWGYSGAATSWACQGTAVGGSAQAFFGGVLAVGTRHFMIVPTTVSARQYNIMGHWAASAEL